MNRLQLELARSRVLHLRFQELFDVLKSRIESVRAGDEPRVNWVLGPSRVGKSALLQALAEIFPQKAVGGRKELPLLLVEVPGHTTPISLPSAVLDAMKVPYPNPLTEVRLNGLMRSQLAMAHTKGLLFDEASHAVEPGSRVAPHAAAGWFKELHTRANVMQILVGVPRLRRLFDADPQLRLRSHQILEWRPYDASKTDELKAFAIAVNTFSAVFNRAGWPIEVPLEVLVFNCYLHAPGLVGALRDLMMEVAKHVGAGAARAVTFADFAVAARQLQGAGDPQRQAFAKENVSLPELNAAYQYVMKIAL